MDQVKRVAHSVKRPLKHGSRGEIFHQFAEWHLYLYLSWISLSPTRCGLILFIYLFGVLCRLQHCTGHITTGSWKGRGNQYTQFVRVLYCKLPTNGKQLPAFPLEAVPGTEPRPQRWDRRGLKQIGSTLVVV